MTPGNTRRCAAATRPDAEQRPRTRARAPWRPALAAWAVALALAAGVCRAQGPQGPSPAQTMAAERTLADWVRAWSAPDQPQKIDPAGTTGACVTLRLGGAVLARATRMGEDGTVVWAAAREAIGDASARMPVERDALREQTLREVAARVTVDLQVAGELTPLPDLGLEQLVYEIAPGVHGVAARAGDRIEAVFPGAMLSMNLSPIQAIGASINKLGLPNASIGDPRVSLASLRKDHGLVLYRFGALQVAQPAAGRPAEFFQRGGRVVPLADVTAANLRALGDGMAKHLLSHKWPGDEPLGLLAAYMPWTGDYDEPRIATPFEQGLTAYALALWGERLGSADPLGARCVEGARGVVLALAERLAAGEPILDDPATAASIALALDALGDNAPRPPLDKLASGARAALGAAATAAIAGNPSATPEVQSIIAAALARLASRPGPNAPLRKTADDLVRLLLRETNPGALPALTPWIGWAELWLAGRDGPIPSAVALRSLRALVWKHQLEAGQVQENARDLVGGVVFTRGGAALPTWQTFRPVALIATMLGDPRLTDDAELPAETVRLLVSLRFLMQLTVGEPEMHMFRDRDRALGGVRLALWDQREAVEASAIGLITVEETLRAFDRRSGR